MKTHRRFIALVDAIDRSDPAGPLCGHEYIRRLTLVTHLNESFDNLKDCIDYSKKLLLHNPLDFDIKIRIDEYEYNSLINRTLRENISFECIIPERYEQLKLF